MRTLTIITISMLAFYSCQQVDHVVVEKWENGNHKTMLDFKSVKDSTYTRTEYFEDGSISSSQDFVNGKLNGKLINYSDKGYKQQEFDYVDGKINGIGTAWYESGKVAFQFKYKEGLHYDGTEYFENGWPRVLVRFSAPGKREGKALYYEEDGHMWMQGYFKDGKEDSTWTKFDKNGTVIETTRYMNGEIVKPDPTKATPQ